MALTHCHLHDGYLGVQGSRILYFLGSDAGLVQMLGTWQRANLREPWYTDSGVGSCWESQISPSEAEDGGSRQPGLPPFTAFEESLIAGGLGRSLSLLPDVHLLSCF